MCRRSAEPEADGDSCDRILKVTVLKEVEFVYVHNEAGINRCQFVTDLLQKKLDKVIMDMSNWDFMLFASKMVYSHGQLPGLGHDGIHTEYHYGGEIICIKSLFSYTRFTGRKPGKDIAAHPGQPA